MLQKLSLMLILGMSLGFDTSAQQERLAAPVYPGAVREIMETTPGAVIFYSKDDAEKIKSHYEQLFGKPESSGTDGMGAFFNVEKDEDPTDYIDQPIRGVNVRSQPLKNNYYVSQAFAQLQSAYLARFKGTSSADRLKHKNDPELQNIIKQYEYLKKSFYLKTNVPNDYGSNVNKGIEQILYEKFFASAEVVRERKMNELMEKYTKMVQQGNMDEAAKYSDKMNSLSRASVETTDKWDTALRYLKELEKLAYTSQITVDLEP